MSQLNVSINGNIQDMYGKSKKCCLYQETTETGSLVPAKYIDL